MLALMAVTVSYGVALLIRNEAALGPVYNTVAQPIMLLAGVLLPIAFAPLWLKRVADWNPFYWATSAMRALFAGHVGNSVVWEGALVTVALTVVALTWSTRLFARSLR
jgi:ABC-2 type transport system permease protein